jgi:hypothetical protein
VSKSVLKYSKERKHLRKFLLTTAKQSHLHQQICTVKVIRSWMLVMKAASEKDELKDIVPPYVMATSMSGNIPAKQTKRFKFMEENRYVAELQN